MVEFEDWPAVYVVVFLGEWDAKRKDLTPLFAFVTIERSLHKRTKIHGQEIPIKPQTPRTHLLGV